jgi:hypothetical protein
MSSSHLPLLRAGVRGTHAIDPVVPVGAAEKFNFLSCGASEPIDRGENWIQLHFTLNDGRGEVLLLSYSSNITRYATAKEH